MTGVDAAAVAIWHQHHNGLVCQPGACTMRPEVTAVFPTKPVSVSLQARHDVGLCSQCGERLSAMVKIGTTDGWCTVCLDEAVDSEAVRAALDEWEVGVCDEACTHRFCFLHRDLRAALGSHITQPQHVRERAALSSPAPADRDAEARLRAEGRAEAVKAVCAALDEVDDLDGLSGVLDALYTASPGAYDEHNEDTLRTDVERADRLSEGGDQ